jgi:signal peptidase I
MSETTNNDANPKKEFVKATRSQKKGSKEILRLGQKVYDYRKDLLSEEDAQNLESANDGLKKALAEKPLSGPQLEEKAKEVDVQLQKSGDLYYHKKSWVENVEMLLVAAIVVIGIRSFFVQPFIIPTNSMYPSFSGMQPHVYEDKESTPGFVGRCVDKLLFGSFSL